MLAVFGSLSAVLPSVGLVAVRDAPPDIEGGHHGSRHVGVGHENPDAETGTHHRPPACIQPWRSHRLAHTRRYPRRRCPSGTLTVYDGRCHSAMHSAGESYIGGQELHRAKNGTESPVEMAVTFVDTAAATDSSRPSQPPPCAFAHR